MVLHNCSGFVLVGIFLGLMFFWSRNFFMVFSGRIWFFVCILSSLSLVILSIIPGALLEIDLTYWHKTFYYFLSKRMDFLIKTGIFKTTSIFNCSGYFNYTTHVYWSVLTDMPVTWGALWAENCIGEGAIGLGAAYTFWAGANPGVKNTTCSFPWKEIWNSHVPC